MKFITEEYLRDLYRKEPFTAYELKLEERLTPGASQYLSDMRINIVNKVVKTELAPECKVNWKSKKLQCKLKSMEALFLMVGNELIKCDVVLAQKVIDIGKKFALVKKITDGVKIECFQLNECTGIKLENFCEDLCDCFEITEFYMCLEKSRELYNLNYLRSSLRELEPIVLEVFEDQKESEIGKNIIGYINSIINSLSQVICLVVGGSKCQRTI